MTDSLQHNITDHQPGERRLLDLKWADYIWPLLFLLSMAMMGLKFPLGYLLVPIILINRFRADRYDFLIMLTIFFGGYGLIGEGTLPVKTWDLAFVASVIGALVLKKRGIVKSTVMLVLFYAVGLVALAMFSEESLMVQLRTLRMYLFFIYFIVPIIAFTGEKFEMMSFFRHLAPYCFIMCIFYALDGFVINGQVLVPNTHVWDDSVSTFYSPTLYGFGSFPRKYPPGLYILALFAFAAARYYKLAAWQWVAVILAFAACKTFTVITGVMVVYVISLPNVGKIVKYSLLGVGAVALVYFIDTLLPQQHNGESALRIQSSVAQLFDLSNAQDDEDIAQLGSGRLGQTLPKVELVSELGKSATGLGFLHAELTKNVKFIIDNEYYSDTTRSEEVATGVEIEPVQVYVTIGYVGLILHILFFVITYLFVRRMPFSYYYLTVLVGMFWFGLGGFANLNGSDGLMLSALAYSAVILSSKGQKELT